MALHQKLNLIAKEALIHVDLHNFAVVIHQPHQTNQYVITFVPADGGTAVMRFLNSTESYDESESSLASIRDEIIALTQEIKDTRISGSEKSLDPIEFIAGIPVFDDAGKALCYVTLNNLWKQSIIMRSMFAKPLAPTTDMGISRAIDVIREFTFTVYEDGTKIELTSPSTGMINEWILNKGVHTVAPFTTDFPIIACCYTDIRLSSNYQFTMEMTACYLDNRERNAAVVSTNPIRLISSNGTRWMINEGVLCPDRDLPVINNDEVVFCD